MDMILFLLYLADIVIGINGVLLFGSGVSAVFLLVSVIALSEQGDDNPERLLKKYIWAPILGITLFLFIPGRDFIHILVAAKAGEVAVKTVNDSELGKKAYIALDGYLDKIIKEVEKKE
jgi:hypothetical protein